MIRRYTVALMQMDTQNDKGKNLETACAWIDEAAAKGAKLICFPEVMNLIGKNIGEGGGREEIPGYTTERLCAKAKEHGIYIHGGSITQALPGEKRSANTSVLISPEGEFLATYSKLHMFDITLADGTPYRESDRVKPGDSIVTVETELGVFGMSICYDVRFPEIYRLMALRGAQVIFVPASFTMPTGKDHWEVLCGRGRSRTAVTSWHRDRLDRNRRMRHTATAWLADPWGTVIARSKDAPGITYAEIDSDYLDKIRKQIPSLENRRSDLYEVSEKK